MAVARFLRPRVPSQGDESLVRSQRVGAVGQRNHRMGARRGTDLICQMENAKGKLQMLMQNENAANFQCKLCKMQMLMSKQNEKCCKMQNARCKMQNAKCKIQNANANVKAKCQCKRKFQCKMRMQNAANFQCKMSNT